MSHADTKKSVSFTSLQKAMRELPPQVFDKGIKAEFKGLFKQMAKNNKTPDGKKDLKFENIEKTLNAKTMATIKENLRSLKVKG